MKWKQKRGQVVLCAIGLSVARLVMGLDWPQYRNDAGRTASTAEQLPDNLHLQWVRELPRRSSAFAYDTRMEHDDCYHPVVVGKTLLVGLEATNSVLALDTDTGAVRWRCYLEGPVRYAPAVERGVAFVAAEDGVLYAIDVGTGRVTWKYQGAPSARRIVNHGRVTSNWPASGGPVVKDGVVYFATGVWPFDGTSVHAVDTATGEEIWRRPAHVVWGYALAAGHSIIVPSGKVPNVYDASSGMPTRSSHLYDVKNLPPAVMCSLGETHVFNGNKAYPLEVDGPVYKSYANAEHHAAIWPPVIDGDYVYGFNDGIFRIYRKPSAEEAEAMGKRKNLVAVGGPWWVNSRPDYAWAKVGEEIPLSAGVELPAGWYPRRMELKAGSKLFASGPGAVIGMELTSTGGTKPRVVFVASVKGERSVVIAADKKLFITDREGSIYCYGRAQISPKRFSGTAVKSRADSPAAHAARAILETTRAKNGYCLVVGLQDGALAEALVNQSSLHVVAVDADRKKVDSLRLRLDEAGRLGRRLVLMAADTGSDRLPTYMARLVVSEDPASIGITADAATVKRLLAVLRPYGGTACLALSQAQHEEFVQRVKEARLPRAVVKRVGPWSLLTRQGPLPGAANWTHERCDAAATLCAPDTAIEPPLGMLWFGGPAAEWHRAYSAFIPPGLLVVDGKYVMQGHGLMSCVDVYTGQLLWEREVPKVQYYGCYINEYPRDQQGNPVYPELGTDKWRASHAGLLPGEIAVEKLSGNALNCVSMPDAIYLTVAEALWVLDPETGARRTTFPVPFEDSAAAKALCWGRLRIDGDILVATAFDPAAVRAAFLAWYQGNEKNKQRMPMRWLFAVTRKTGTLLWKRRAENGFLNHGFVLGNGRVYCIDTLSPPVLEAYGKAQYPHTPTQPMLYALHLKDGSISWDRPLSLYVPTLNYAANHDCVVLPARDQIVWEDERWKLQAGDRKKKGRVMDSTVLAYKGRNGEVLWKAENLSFDEPAMVHGDYVIGHRGAALNLADGTPVQRPDPLTGQVRPWKASAGGCNYLIGSTYVTTHRTCYQDMRYQHVVPLPGMRSGCSPSVVPANGVMSVFNYSANYPSDELRSAYVLVSRPHNANWTSLGESRGQTGAQRLAAAKVAVSRLGLNLAVTRDLVGPEGVPWLGQPAKEPEPAVRRRGRRSQPAEPLVKCVPDTIASFVLDANSVRHVPAQGWAPIVASGFIGVTELNVRLVPEAVGGLVRYTVRLHLLEPEDVKPGERVFSVRVQGAEVVKDLDLVKEGGGRLHGIVRVVKGVAVRNWLTISLSPGPGSKPSVLSGIDVKKE